MSDGRMPILGIVPARGGSKGIARKNMRSVAGRPLVAHTLEAVQASGVVDRLIVSSDDHEILRWAQLHGYEVMERPAELASDDATIADVARQVVEATDWSGIVGVFQATSPLRSKHSIEAAVRHFFESGADSLMSVTREPHLFWLDEHDDLARATPLFQERRNRQFAHHQVVRETGAIQIIRADLLSDRRDMIGEHHVLFELPPEESLDIDTLDDLAVARRRLERGTVVFRLRANAEVGSGHLFHCVRLSEELEGEEIRFLLVDCDRFVHDVLKARGFPFRDERRLADDLEALRGPGRNVIVNDVLDTSENEIVTQRTAGFRVVNIEDLGPGARFADWVVNALYPVRTDGGAHVAYGSRYATLRSEFHGLPDKPIREHPERMLVTFGGTDPGRLAPRFSRILSKNIDVSIEVVLGPGAPPMDDPPPGVVVHRSVPSMAAAMMDADLVLTSAGRTVYEAAVTGTPVVVVAQNAREATHAHIGYESGVVFLGIGPLVDDEHVVEIVTRLLGDHGLRAELSRRLRNSVDTAGAERIADRIRRMLRGLDDES